MLVGYYSVTFTPLMDKSLTGYKTVMPVTDVQSKAKEKILSGLYAGHKLTVSG